MLEALWSVEFESSQGIAGAGVVVFETGRIYGGDAQYYYVGKGAADSQGNVSGYVDVFHYSGHPSSVFGWGSQFRVNLSGRVQAPVMDLQGHLDGNPSQRMVMRCTRRAELP
jgi:hypothetical protein